MYYLLTVSKNPVSPVLFTNFIYRSPVSANYYLYLETLHLLYYLLTLSEYPVSFVLITIFN